MKYSVDLYIIVWFDWETFQCQPSDEIADSFHILRIYYVIHLNGMPLYEFALNGYNTTIF